MKWVGSDLCKQGVESRFARKKASRGLDAPRGRKPPEGLMLREEKASRGLEASRGKRPGECFASRGRPLKGSTLKPGEHILIHKNHVSP